MAHQPVCGRRRMERQTCVNTASLLLFALLILPFAYPPAIAYPGVKSAVTSAANAHLESSTPKSSNSSTSVSGLLDATGKPASGELYVNLTSADLAWDGSCIGYVGTITLAGNIPSNAPSNTYFEWDFLIERIETRQPRHGELQLCWQTTSAWTIESPCSCRARHCTRRHGTILLRLATIFQSK